MTASRIGGGIIWTVLMLLSVGVAGYAFFHVATGFKQLPLENPMLSPYGLQTHVAASAVALLLGPFQFVKSLRAKFPVIHRWSGRIYVAACIVGGLAGGVIAMSTTSGAPAGYGFLTLAILWLITTGMALASVLRRDFAGHERWMIRSFSLTLAAVTLRIYLPIAIIQNHGDFPVPAYQLIAWIAWVPNLLIAELWIALRRKPRARAVATA
jgi:Predicted membrane protein (DUF2306)